MGVTSVFQWPIPDTQSGQQEIESLYERLELKGGVNQGAFTVDCETYQTSLGINLQKVMYVLHDSDYPMSTFAIVDTQQSSSNPSSGPTPGAGGHNLIVADHMFDLIMTNLSSVYTAKKSVRIECKGRKYHLGDFVLKVGSVTMGTNFKGILIEAGCCNISNISHGWENIKSFIQLTLEPVSALGGLSQPTHLMGRPPGPYTPRDTILQYLDLFNVMRRGTVSSVSTTTQHQ